MKSIDRLGRNYTEIQEQYGRDAAECGGRAFKGPIPQKELNTKRKQIAGFAESSCYNEGIKNKERQEGREYGKRHEHPIQRRV